MKRKHFILALVAMLWSFSFSAFADDVIVVRSWAELKAALEANDGVQRSAARQRSTAMRATGTQIPGTPYFYEDFAGKRVLLEADVVEESPVTIALEGSATIDLNGHIMKGSTDEGSHTYPIVNNGNLLVVDNSDNGNGAIYCGIKTGVKFTTGDINRDAVFVMTGGSIICAHENDDDDDAALVNHGIAYITGGTIEGAKNAVWNDEGSKFYAKVPALIDGTVINNGTSDVQSGVPVVAKIGTAKYTSLNAAFAAAKEGETIKMLADATPALTSQKAITKASVIDLNGNTLTLNEDDLYFGTTTFQNGTIVVDPSVKASTAVFWMFENQTLTFDDVDVVATGVTGTYLIGTWNGANTAINILNGSSITIDNATTAALTAVICDNGTGNSVTIENSKIDVKNIEGRFYLGGKNGSVTVENSDVDLTGVKEGFYLRAGQTLDVKGNSTVDVTLNSNEGRWGINCTEFTSIYNKEESATVNATVFELQAAAMIGTTKYVTLQAAINAVKNGETIVLVSDCAEAVTFTQTKDVSFVLDGNHKTYTGSINITARAGKDAASTLVIQNFNFKTDAIAHDFIKSVEKNYYPNNITITGCSFEGTSDVNTADYAVVAVRLRSANNIAITNCTGSGLHSFLQNTAGWNMQIDNVDVTNSLSGFAMGTIQGATIKNCDLTVEKSGIRFDAQYNNNAVLENNKVEAFVPVVVRKASVDSNIAVNGTNTMNQTNTDGYWMVIGTSEYEANGELPTAATGRVRVALNDDNLSEDGIYGNFVAIAKIGENEYASLQEAIKAVKNGETITLLRDDCAEDVVVTQAPDVKITIDGNNKEFAGTITVDGKSAAYATAGLTIKNVKFLADGISKDASINLGGSNAIRYTSNVTVEGCTFTGTNKDKVGIKSYTGGDKNLTITNCFANGMHSLAQVKNVTGVTVSGCTIENSKNGIALGKSTNVAISGANITTDGYGIRVDATQATTMTVTDAVINANIPVVAREATGNYNIDFNGSNVFNAGNDDRLWLAIGQEELYDVPEDGPAITTENLGAATGNMIVTLNGDFSAPGTNVIGAVAKVANNDCIKYYTKLQDAINACAEGNNTVEILAAVVEDVTIVQQEGINVVLEGNDNTFDGTIYIEGQSRNEGAETLTIQNVNFTTSEASHYFIDSNSTESAKRYAHNVTINGCDFTATGAAVNTAVAARIRQGFDIKFVGGEFTGLHSVLQGYGIAGVELDGVKAVSCKNGAALGTSTNAVVKNVEFDCAGYGIRVDASVATTLAVENSTIKAMIPVVGRKATADYSIVFNGTNEFEANNGDNNVWCVVGAEEYGDVTLDKVGAVTGNATVTLNDTGLNKAGIHAVKATIDKVCYFSFADALAAAKAGDTIDLLADVEAKEVILLDKSITINGNGKTVTSSATRVFRVTTSDINVTMNDVKVTSTAVRVGQNDIRGIAIDASVENVELTLNNCSLDFTDASASDWAYGVNVARGDNHKITINGGTYEGANVVNIWGNNNTVSIDGATLNSLYAANDMYWGLCVKINEGTHTVSVKNSVFNGDNAKAIEGVEATEDNNTDNTRYYVAKAGNEYYYTFAEAVTAAEANATVKLLHSSTGEGVVIDKDLTIDFNGKTYTVNKTVGSAGTTTLGFQILKDNNVTLKNGTLTSTAVTEGKEVKMLVQNYANLTVDNMKLVDATDHILYVLSNNSGTVNVVNGSEITTDAIALDACKYASYAAPTVTVAEGVKVTGDVEASATLNFAGTLNGNIVINGVDGKVTTAQDKKVTTTVEHYNVNYADGAYKLVEKNYIAQVGDKKFEVFEDALYAVENGGTITLLGGAFDESAKELGFEEAITFTITGEALEAKLPVITFKNATVNIKDAKFQIPELDARENAIINVDNSIVVDAGGNSIVKSYYNGKINITNNSTVYAMQVTTMGYINIDGTSVLNATWQTNVYGNGLISLAEGATFNTAALHLTGQDYSNRDNTDADRKGKPATIVVDGATLTVGMVKSYGGSDYSYNSSKGLNVGTIAGKAALLDIKNGAKVNFYMANGQTTNFGADATVNVAAGTELSLLCRGEGVAKLDNKGAMDIAGAVVVAGEMTNDGTINFTSDDATLATTTAGLTIGYNVHPDKKVRYAEGVYKVVYKDYVAKIGEQGYESLAEALTAATDGATVELLWSEGAAPIAMAGTVCGNKTVTITGTANVDWNKGWLYVGRNGVGNGKIIFNNASLTSVSNSTSLGINVSGSKKNSDTTNDGAVELVNSTIVLDYLINKGAMSLDNSTLTVKNGFATGGRPASETEDGLDATATMDLKNGSKLVVNNHNGQGLGYEALGIMNIDKTSTFETTKPFLVTAKGTMNVAGTVKIAGALTNKGAINFTDLAATLATTTNNLTIGYDPTVIPESYKVIYDNNGVYRFAHYVARIDDVYYESLEAALNALEDGKTLVLVENIEISDKWSTFGVNVAATIDGNGYTLTFTGEVNDADNYNGIFRFENNMAVKNLTIDASNATGIERAISAKLGITVDNCEFIGKGNGYAVIFGEGAEVADLANAEVSITNSKFTNWSKGVSDNANGEDAKKVTISDNTFDKASVNVSAREYVNFTKNTVEGGDVIITSYSNAVGVEVQATTNELEEGRTYQIISNPTNIVPQAEFSVPVARIDTKYYLTLQEAVNVDNSTIILVDNIRLAEAVVVEGKTATLDLNNKWIRPVDNSVTMTGGLIRLHEGANLTINDNGKDKKGEIYTNGNHNVYAAVSVLGDNASLTVNGGKLTGYYYGIAGNGNYEGTTVTINGGEIASIEGTGSGIYHPQNGTLTVKGGTITGATGIYFKSGALTVTGGTIHGTGSGDYKYNGSGSDATGDALVIENVAEGGYEAISGVSITGGTFISDNAAPIASYGDSKLVEFLGDGCNALFNNTFDESLLVVGYQLKDEDNDGFYGVKWTNYRQSMVFVDGEFTEYTHIQDMKVGELTYQRRFSTAWTPLYVPFEIPVSELAEDFEIAYINGVRRTDKNENGVLENDEFNMELIYIHGGKNNLDGSGRTLKANYPYFIRSKQGTVWMDITLKEAVLYAAKDITYDCTTMTEKYEITGNNSEITSDKFAANQFTVGTSGWTKIKEGTSLKPFRFYLTITSRENSEALVPMVSMSIVVRGEEREDGTTLIYDIEEEQSVDYIYDLHGRRVMEPQKGGIYIINGKKVVF